MNPDDEVKALPDKGMQREVKYDKDGSTCVIRHEENGMIHMFGNGCLKYAEDIGMLSKD
jgi:hypothetical protein